jgi:hypothetical protein
MRRSHLKRKPKKAPTAAEKRHIARVAEMPCLVSEIEHMPLNGYAECSGRTTVHHVSSDGFQRIARSPARVTPLCQKHHLIQYGPHESVERLGHRGFLQIYGIDLLAMADKLWAESERLEAARNV